MTEQRPLRVAVVHSFYSSALPSGENQVVTEQVRALRDAGHEVLLLGRRTDDLEGVPGYAARAALRVATGRGGDPTSRLAEFEPDVVHVHNLFPNIGTEWLRRFEAPVVATLHNYRPVCANGLLLREGAVCTACPDGNGLASLRFGCYRESRLATLPLTLRSLRRPDPLLARANALVALSQHASSMWARFGVPDERLRLVPNFVSDLGRAVAPAPEQQRWLFAGRFTPEKGLGVLLDEWPVGVPLDIVGSGPEPELARARTARLVGPLPREELRARMRGYTGLVLPSLCVENAPQVVVEALEAGLPVVVRAGGSTAPEVLAAGAGAVWGDAVTVADALDAVVTGGEAMRVAARVAFDAHYREDRWLQAMESVYRSVM